MNIVRYDKFVTYTGVDGIHFNLMHIKSVRIMARYVVEYGRLPTGDEWIEDWIRRDSTSRYGRNRFQFRKMSSVRALNLTEQGG